MGGLHGALRKCPDMIHKAGPYADTATISR
jgi:hypothetical protein